MRLMFSWDERKNVINDEKHGLNFADAQWVFESQTVTFKDDRFDYGEERYITLGTLESRVVVIVHTPRADTTRIISMRKANAKEQEIYKKRLEAR